MRRQHDADASLKALRLMLTTIQLALFGALGVIYAYKAIRGGAGAAQNKALVIGCPRDGGPCKSTVVDMPKGMYNQYKRAEDPSKRFGKPMKNPPTSRHPNFQKSKKKGHRKGHS